MVMALDDFGGLGPASSCLGSPQTGALSGFPTTTSNLQAPIREQEGRNDHIALKKLSICETSLA
jgi:hypothetical protein